ncbi:hypothetical protein ACWGJP_14045 [Microbacterium sp. NPDC055903]
MSDERQPEAVWYFPPQKNKRWKVWLLVGLGVVAVALVLMFLLVVLPGSFRPEPTGTATPSPSPSASVTATPTPTVSPTPTSTPTAPPTAPPVTDPSMDAFAAQVRPVLDDAVTGLGYAAEDGGESGANDVMLLQQDAERLSDAVAPSSIAGDWSEGVQTYLDALNTLQSAYRSGNGVSGAESTAQDALQSLRGLVGL